MRFYPAQVAALRRRSATVILVAPPPTQAPPQLRRFTAGDPLRALAALGVVLLHVSETQSIEPGATYGQLPARAFAALPVAVNIFFVLSGYLVARPFVRALLYDSPPPALGRYLRRRAFRIVPAYWVVLTVLLWVHGSLGATPAQLLATYALLQDPLQLPTNTLLPQMWSVTLELCFYALVPLAALAFAALLRRADQGTRVFVLAVALIAGWVLSVLLRIELPQGDPGIERLALLLPTSLWVFIPGIALALIELLPARPAAPADRAAPIRAWLRGPVGWALPLGLLGLALVAYAELTALDLSAFYVRSSTVLIAMTAFSGALVAAPLVQQWAGRRCWRWLDNRPLQWIGVRSYSVYLVHLPLIEALKTPVLDRLSGWPAFGVILLLSVPASLLVAHASYELIERPFLERRLPWRRPAPVVVTA
jgi:peptidoglycan/LPS O-acetylase OafA/YrhL